MSRGILTMAFGSERYIRMAKGMVRSLRRHDREIPVAIVSDREAPCLTRWFDEVVPIRQEFGPGLAQKLNLDAYTPFDETLFVDSDFLFFSDPQAVWRALEPLDGFGLVAYPIDPADGHYAVDDLPAFMERLELSEMLMTNTGILYFDRSVSAKRVFDLARKIAARGDELGLKRHPVGFYNDEPVFAAAIASLGLPFAPIGDDPLFTLAGLGMAGMAELDVRRKRSAYVRDGRVYAPTLVHFNVGSQESRLYDRELRRLAYGRIIGQTPLPDLVTRLRWRSRTLFEK